MQSCTQIAITAALLLLLARHRCKEQCRTRVVPANKERVVILGASTVDGIGAAIAAESLARGVRQVMLVGRNEQGLKHVKEHLCAKCGSAALDIVLRPADCSNTADVLAARDAAADQFGGIDTLYIVFGSMIDSTLLGITGNDPIRDGKDAGPTTQSGLANLHGVMERACTINVSGTALTLASFVPLMQKFSMRPHICVIGSLASVIPAPTRAIYAAVKAAQQQLVLGFATECASQARVPGISLVKFTVLAPGSVDTSFSARRSNAGAMRATDVARCAVVKVDAGKTGVVPVPGKYIIAWIASIFA